MEYKKFGIGILAGSVLTGTFDLGRVLNGGGSTQASNAAAQTATYVSATATATQTATTTATSTATPASSNNAGATQPDVAPQAA